MSEVSKKIAGMVEIPQDIALQIREEVASISDFKKLVESFLDKNVTKMLEVILGCSINFSASDIHMEPGKEKAKIRARIDGILQEVLFLDKKIYENLLSRIKLLSELKFNISDRPQAARFSILWQDSPIEIRTATIPAEYGESVVMRILNPKNLISMEELGLRKDLFKKFESEIKKPNGMIV